MYSKVSIESFNIPEVESVASCKVPVSSQFSSQKSKKIDKTIRKRDRIKSLISYYFSSNSKNEELRSETTTLLASSSPNDKSNAFEEVTSTATVIESEVAAEKPEEKYEKTIQNSKRYTLLRKLGLVKQHDTNNATESSMRSGATESNSLNITKGCYKLPKNEFVYDPRLSLRLKIRSRLALKPKPSDNDLENPLFVIPADVATTITECLLDERSVISSEKRSTFDLNLDIEDHNQDSSLIRNDGKCDQYSPVYLHSFKIYPPPQKLPKDQHAKWERRQIFKHAATNFDQEKWRERQLLLANQENFHASSNFLPLNKTENESKIKAPKIIKDLNNISRSNHKNTEAIESAFSPALKLGSVSSFFFPLKSTALNKNSANESSKSHNCSSFSTSSLTKDVYSLNRTTSASQRLSFAGSAISTSTNIGGENNYRRSPRVDLQYKHNRLAKTNFADISDFNF
ncbi:uncharacterized protein PRCAT00003453001 [Priceomyces carsonii]|uniref:uncharacterized protein n=1 Tax=Priceomyces carsonii TaxID=28549 RepID=UPI002EDADF46|nr:unnamed protein product [Priceomyces carsonii]